MPILPHKADLALDALIMGLDGALKAFLGIVALSPIKLLSGGIRLYRYPLYVQDFDKIGQGAIVKNAKLVGWRFLVTQGGKTVAVDFKADAQGKYHFHSFNTEGHIETLQTQIDALQVKDDYRVADLQVPGLNLLSFWLQPQAAGKPDLISPIDPTPPEFVAGTQYTATDFQVKVETVAQTRGCANILPPATLGPSIDVNKKYKLTHQALGDAVALDGVAAMQRPAMKAANGSTLQQWRFVDQGGGYYRLHCEALGNTSALEGGPKNFGALMNGTANQSGQFWRMVDLGNGYITLMNQFTEADNYAFDGGLLNAGALISLSGKQSQNWKFTVVP